MGNIKLEEYLDWLEQTLRERMNEGDVRGVQDAIAEELEKAAQIERCLRRVGERLGEEGTLGAVALESILEGLSALEERAERAADLLGRARSLYRQGDKQNLATYLQKASAIDRSPELWDFLVGEVLTGLLSTSEAQDPDEPQRASIRRVNPAGAINLAWQIFEGQLVVLRLGNLSDDEQSVALDITAGGSSRVRNHVVRLRAQSELRPGHLPDTRILDKWLSGVTLAPGTPLEAIATRGLEQWKASVSWLGSEPKSLVRAQIQDPYGEFFWRYRRRGS